MGVRQAIALPVLGLVAAGMVGCTTIADYSADAYKTATTLKAETDSLIDKSGEKFSAHAKDADELTTKINAAYEFDRGRPQNEISTAEWQILRDPQSGLYGTLVETWKAEGKLSAGYRAEQKKEIDAAFDYIICLEANKQAAVACKQAASATPPAK